MKQRHTLNTNGGLIVTFLLDELTSLPFVQPAAAAGDEPYSIKSLGNSSGSCSSSTGAAAADIGAGMGSGSSCGFRCKPSCIVVWDDCRDYGAGMPIPPALVDDGCPAAVFSFVQDDRAWVQY